MNKNWFTNARRWKRDNLNLSTADNRIGLARLVTRDLKQCRLVCISCKPMTHYNEHRTRESCHKFSFSLPTEISSDINKLSTIQPLDLRWPIDRSETISFEWWLYFEHFVNRLLLDYRLAGLKVVKHWKNCQKNEYRESQPPNVQMSVNELFSMRIT